MRPQNVLDSSATIKITLPAQLYVDSESNLSAGTVNVISTSQANIEVKFNRIIYIRNAFINGLNPVDTFFVKMTNFVNPPTTQVTDSFAVIIYENNDETAIVSQYVGNGLTSKAEPSTALTISKLLTETRTGEVQSSLMLTGTMDISNPIAKQAYLKILIPGAFTVDNAARSASTCTRVSGFSDEITCSFETTS